MTRGGSCRDYLTISDGTLDNNDPDHTAIASAVMAVDDMADQARLMQDCRRVGLDHGSTSVTAPM